MRIVAHDKLGKIIEQEITRVVIYDDNDNPISLAIKYGNNLCHTSHVDDEEFVRMLGMFGVDKIVKIRNFSIPTIGGN